jgi:hypothetical protein
MSEPNMNQEDVLDPNTQEQMTPEQYLKARNAAITHLKSEITYLKVEKEYEVLMADIEEAKTRRITMIVQRARFYQKQEAPETQVSKPDVEQPVKEEPKKRTLKTD